jgi:6-phosphofructokinase 1
LAPLTTIANDEKTLPDEYINREGNFVTEAFLEYARPLIGEPLPTYVRLQKVPVERRLL